MTKNKQTEVSTYSFISDMWSHFVWFVKWCFSYFVISLLYFLVCILVGWKCEVIYILVLNLTLPALWYKLRRYRVRDKAKLHFIYLMILLSILLQILINKGVFVKLQTLLWEIGGN